MCNLSDLFDKKHKLRPFEYWTGKGLATHNWLKWCGLINSVKYINKFEAKSKENSFEIENKNIFECTTKEVYNYVNQMAGAENLHVPRVANYVSLYNKHEWQDIYTFVFTFLIDTKSKDFQNKFLQDILVNRYWLHKWNITGSNVCRLCGNNVENIHHMFWDCKYVKTFWSDLNYYLYSKLKIKLSKEEIFLGLNKMVLNTITKCKAVHI